MAQLAPPPWVNEVNKSILSFLGHNPSRIDLGPSFEQLNEVSAETALQLYRMHKNFEEPSDENATARKHDSIMSMVSYDENGLDSFFVPVNTKMDPFVRHQLYKVREKLRENVAHYSFSSANLEFPSGETFESASGDISLYAKLRDRSQFTITSDCIPLFTRIAYNTPMLKFAIRRHFKALCKTRVVLENGAMKVKFRKYDPDVAWKRALELQHHVPGTEVTSRQKSNAAYSIFKEMVKQVVIVVPGARLTTVPKSLEVDRVITCEPLCNMIVQRTIEQSVRDIIKKVYDVDLETSQHIHKLLICDLDNATIDLKNASNSVFLQVVKWFLGGTRLYHDLCAARSKRVMYVDGYWHDLKMLSPMGNGYTFGVMSLLLLTLVREFDSLGMVFGDDIIVHKDVAPSVMDLIQQIGFSINTKKTFTQGYFRESCGGFFAKSRYITSFDLNWAEDEVDAVVLVNKIAILAYTTQSKIRRKLQALHADLIELVPPSLLRGAIFKREYATRKLEHETLNLLSLEKAKRGYDGHHLVKDDNLRKFYSSCIPLLEYDNSTFSLTDGVYVPMSMLHKKYSQAAARKTQSMRGSQDVKDLQLGGEELYARLHLTKKSEVYRRKGRLSSEGVKLKGQPLKPLDNITRLFGWYYVWAGKVQAPNLRETYVSSKWVLDGPKFV